MCVWGGGAISEELLSARNKRTPPPHFLNKGKRRFAVLNKSLCGKRQTFISLFSKSYQEGLATNKFKILNISIGQYIHQEKVLNPG